MLRPALAVTAVSAACALAACGQQDTPATEEESGTTIAAAPTTTPSISTVVSTSMVTVTEEAPAPTGASVEERCELGRLTSDLGLPPEELTTPYCTAGGVMH